MSVLNLIIFEMNFYCSLAWLPPLNATLCALNEYPNMKQRIEYEYIRNVIKVLRALEVCRNKKLVSANIYSLERKEILWWGFSCESIKHITKGPWKGRYKGSREFIQGFIIWLLKFAVSVIDTRRLGSDNLKRALKYLISDSSGS